MDVVVDIYHLLSDIRCLPVYDAEEAGAGNELDIR